MCGEVKVKTDKKDKDDKPIEETRPLITISDLQRMKMNEVIIRRIRMAPFKTKLTPEWQMKWEHKYRETSVNSIKARDKRIVEMFDVREFVKSKKKSAPSPFGSSPFGGGNSFGSPFGSMESPSFPGLFDSMPRNDNPSSKIDVDKILANLDAKIAEIEAEEKKIAEEEKQNAKISTKDTKAINNINNNSFENRKENIPLSEIVNVKPINNSQNTNNSYMSNNINNDNTSIKNILPSLDDDFKPISKEQNYTKEEFGNVKPMIDKIETINNLRTNNMSDNMNYNRVPNMIPGNMMPGSRVSNNNLNNYNNGLNNSNNVMNNNVNMNNNINNNLNNNLNTNNLKVYSEVSDDEFFDDFFDD